MKKILLIITALMLLCALWLLSKPAMSEIGITYAKPAEAGQALTVTWFGVTTLLIDDGVTQILIDGYFSRPSLLDIALERTIEPDLAAIKGMLDRFEINRLKAVIPVHSHFDHALDSAEIANQTGAQLMGSTTTAQIAAGSSLATHQVSVRSAPLKSPFTRPSMPRWQLTARSLARLPRRSRSPRRTPPGNLARPTRSLSLTQTAECWFRVVRALYRVRWLRSKWTPFF